VHTLSLCSGDIVAGILLLGSYWVAGTLASQSSTKAD
jgi:hypothetical protein